MNKNESKREPGSFRDPSGAVLYLDGAVYRGLDESTFELMRDLDRKGLLEKSADDGLIARTGIVADDSVTARKLRETFPGFKHFIEHERIPFISYPYEWSVAMLGDAAILHLDLQCRLLQHGYSLKDASAFNVAFAGSKPVFMDLPSIEIPRRRDVWIAYGQFCRMFLFPILLHRYRGLTVKQCFLSDLEGPSVVDTRRMLGLWNSLRPAALIDVFFQYILNQSAEKKSVTGIRSMAHGSDNQTGTPKDGVMSGVPSSKTNDPGAQTMNLGRLRRKLLKILRDNRSQSVWSSYESLNSYDDSGVAGKDIFVKTFLETCRPRRVLDLGANTGRYSLMAAAAGASVLAIDADHDCIDLLYRRLRGKPADILPLCVDVTNPAPALGFRHRERKSFEQRADFDGVLALALVHHLLVSARIPLPELCDLFAALTNQWLIVEFVAVHDPMFQQLLTTRENYYGDLTPEKFHAAFERRFVIEKQRVIMDGRRVLYFMRKHRPG